LSLMLAGFKTQCSTCVRRALEPCKYRQGFFADELNDTLTCLPEHLWKAKRRKRTYVNQVLARAEALSAYQPARRLWVRTVNGHYLPNPLMQLRTHAGVDAPSWRPVYEVLNQTWVDAGTDVPNGWEGGMMETLLAATRRVTEGRAAVAQDTEVEAPSAAT